MKKRHLLLCLLVVFAGLFSTVMAAGGKGTKDDPKLFDLLGGETLKQGVGDGGVWYKLDLREADIHKGLSLVISNQGGDDIRVTAVAYDSTGETSIKSITNEAIKFNSNKTITLPAWAAGHVDTTLYVNPITHTVSGDPAEAIYVGGEIINKIDTTLYGPYSVLMFYLSSTGDVAVSGKPVPAPIGVGCQNPISMPWRYYVDGVQKNPSTDEDWEKVDIKWDAKEVPADSLRNLRIDGFISFKAIKPHKVQGVSSVWGLKVTITNLDEENEAEVTASIGLTCGSALETMTRKIPAGGKAEKVLNYSMVQQVTGDNVFVAVEGNRRVRVEIAGEPQVAITQEGSANAKLLAYNTTYYTDKVREDDPATGSINENNVDVTNQNPNGYWHWVKINIRDLENMSKDSVLKIIYTNSNAYPIKMSEMYKFRADDDEQMSKEEYTIPANGQVAHSISPVQIRQYLSVTDTVDGKPIPHDYIWYYLDTDVKGVVGYQFKLDAADPGSICSSAFAYTLSSDPKDTITIKHNSLNPVWYKIDYQAALDTLNGAIALVVMNNGKEETTINAEIKFDCAGNATPQSKAIAAGQKMGPRTLGHATLESFKGHEVYVSITSDKKVPLVVKAYLVYEKLSDDRACLQAEPHAVSATVDDVMEIKTDKDTSAWYYLDLADLQKPGHERDLYVTIEAINGGKATIEAKLAYSCPATSFQEKSLTFTDKYERAIAYSQVANMNNPYLGIKTKYSVRVTLHPAAPELLDEEINFCEGGKNEGEDIDVPIKDFDSNGIAPIAIAGKDSTWFRFDAKAMRELFADNKVYAVFTSAADQDFEVAYSSNCQILYKMSYQKQSVSKTTNRRSEITADRLELAGNSDVIWVNIKHQANYSVKLEIVPIEKGSDCAHAETFAANTTYEQEAGTAKWFLVPISEFLKTGLQNATLTLKNLDTKPASLNGTVYPRCGAQQSLGSQKAGLSVGEIKVKQAGMSGYPDTVFVLVEATSKVSYRLDLVKETGENCDEALTFDWENGNIIPSGTKGQWINVKFKGNVDPSNGDKVTIYIANLSKGQTNKLQAGVAYNCVDGVQQSGSRTLAANDTLSRDVTSMIGARDSILIFVLPEQATRLWAEVEKQEPLEEPILACAEATTVTYGQWYPVTAGEEGQWFVVSVADLQKNTIGDGTFRVRQTDGKAVDFKADFSYECPIYYPMSNGKTLKLNADADGYTKGYTRDVLRSDINGVNAENVYIFVSAKGGNAEFMLDIKDLAGLSCETPIHYRWGDTAVVRTLSEKWFAIPLVDLQEEVGTDKQHFNRELGFKLNIKNIGANTEKIGLVYTSDCKAADEAFIKYSYELKPDQEKQKYLPYASETEKHKIQGSPLDCGLHPIYVPVTDENGNYIYKDVPNYTLWDNPETGETDTIYDGTFNTVQVMDSLRDENGNAILENRCFDTIYVKIAANFTDVQFFALPYAEVNDTITDNFCADEIVARKDNNHGASLGKVAGKIYDGTNNVRFHKIYKEEYPFMFVHNGTLGYLNIDVDSIFMWQGIIKATLDSVPEGESERALDVLLNINPDSIPVILNDSVIGEFANVAVEDFIAKWNIQHDLADESEDIVFYATQAIDTFEWSISDSAELTLTFFAECDAQYTKVYEGVKCYADTLRDAISVVGCEEPEDLVTEVPLDGIYKDFHYTVTQPYDVEVGGELTQDVLGELFCPVKLNGVVYVDSANLVLNAAVDAYNKDLADALKLQVVEFNAEGTGAQIILCQGTENEQVVNIACALVEVNDKTLEEAIDSVVCDPNAEGLLSPIKVDSVFVPGTDGKYAYTWQNVNYVQIKTVQDFVDGLTLPQVTIGRKADGNDEIEGGKEALKAVEDAYALWLAEANLGTASYIDIPAELLTEEGQAEFLNILKTNGSNSVALNDFCGNTASIDLTATVYPVQYFDDARTINMPKACEASSVENPQRDSIVAVVIEGTSIHYDSVYQIVETVVTEALNTASQFTLSAPQKVTVVENVVDDPNPTVNSTAAEGQLTTDLNAWNADADNNSPITAGALTFNATSGQYEVELTDGCANTTTITFDTVFVEFTEEAKTIRDTITNAVHEQLTAKYDCEARVDESVDSRLDSVVDVQGNTTYVHYTLTWIDQPYLAYARLAQPTLTAQVLVVIDTIRVTTSIDDSNVQAEVKGLVDTWNATEGNAAVTATFATATEAGVDVTFSDVCGDLFVVHADALSSYSEFTYDSVYNEIDNGFACEASRDTVPVSTSTPDENNKITRTFDVTITNAYASIADQDASQITGLTMYVAHQVNDVVNDNEAELRAEIDTWVAGLVNVNNPVAVFDRAAKEIVITDDCGGEIKVTFDLQEKEVAYGEGVNQIVYACEAAADQVLSDTTVGLDWNGLKYDSISSWTVQTLALKSLEAVALDEKDIHVACGRQIDLSAADAAVKAALTAAAAAADVEDVDLANLAWTVTKADGSAVALGADLKSTVTFLTGEKLTVSYSVVTECSTSLTAQLEITVDAPTYDEYSEFDNVNMYVYPDKDHASIFAIDVEDAAEKLGVPSSDLNPEDVEWHRVLGGVDVILTEADGAKGWYYTPQVADENGYLIIPDADYYVIFKVDQQSGDECGAQMRTITIQARLKANEMPMTLTPNAVNPGEMITLKHIDGQEATVVVYDMMGNMISSENINGLVTYSFRAQDNSGYYLVKVINGERVQSFKYVVK
ncbi:MAG: T9SS type A sorting domain-containing protein [Paludibacteraceae bacterium]|nr:T9SS type A sorting domain-containing protein [Paludibacteraceae bacterium]